MNFTEQERDWLIKELEIMLEESEEGKKYISQFSKIMMRSILGKLHEIDV